MRESAKIRGLGATVEKKAKDGRFGELVEAHTPHALIEQLLHD
jgi:hypothetical protein